jgi:hypothetical protein
MVGFRYIIVNTLHNYDNKDEDDDDDDNNNDNTLSPFLTVRGASNRLTVDCDGASPSPFDKIHIHTPFNLLAPLLTSATHFRYSVANDRGGKAQKGKLCVK